MPKAKAQDLIGRKIVAVDFRPFKAYLDPKSKTMAHDPTITLDNGRRLYFLTEQTENATDGVWIGITDKKGK